MKGNDLDQFIDDLYSMGGPEKEFIYKGNSYFLESANIGNNTIEMVVFQCFGKGEYIFRCTGKDFAECARQFEKAIRKRNTFCYETLRRTLHIKCDL